MPVSKITQQKLQTLATHFKQILETLDYDLTDRNLRDTPTRVAKLWLKELGKQSPTRKLFRVFPEEHSQMICCIGHLTWTRCPHHLERVRLIVSIGYVPNGYVIGLSKLARIADFYARGLVLQETYTDTLAEGLLVALKAKGVGVRVLGRHLCMRARGPKTSSVVATTALRGSFLDDPTTREEFLACVTNGGKYETKRDI